VVELGFAGGAWFLYCGLVFPAAFATRKQRRCRKINNHSFFRSLMAIYSDVNTEARETCPGVEGQRIRLLQVMMLLILLISRKMIFGENMSFARLAGGGIEGCVVGTGVGR
jgi:hypothetical protein